MTNYDASFTGLYCIDILGVPINAIPPDEQCHFIDEIRLTVAGTAGGTAVDAAKLGLRCLAVGALGDDEKADFLLNTLQHYGIDSHLMRRYAKQATAASILTIRPNGARPALHARGVSQCFTLTEQAQQQALDARVVHFGGTGLLTQLDGQPTVDFMRAAKLAGRITTYDLIAANQQTRALIQPVLPYVDYFMPSIDEAAVICGTHETNACVDDLLALGAQCVALSLGADGCLIGDKQGRRLALPAFPVKVIDTTGCGDAFSAGFIAGLIKGYDLAQCGQLANACGALVASGLGSDAGITSFEQVLAMVQPTTSCVG